MSDKQGLRHRLWSSVRRRPRTSGLVGIAGAALLAWLAFGYFGVHTLFFDRTVDEANPFVPGPGASGLPMDEVTAEMADDMNEAMEEEDMPLEQEVEEPMDEAMAETVVEGEFIDRSHPTSGVAKVITDGEQRFLRLEDFETDNGPDLSVYLATGPPDGSPGDFIDLGDLKGNIGNQNYEIPPEVDVDEFSTVFIWCVRFSVAFGAAPLG